MNPIAVGTPIIVGPFLFLLVLGFVVFWLFQFIHLMRQHDDFFPGRFDKPIWAALFILVAPIAPFLYFFWKISQEAERLKTG